MISRDKDDKLVRIYFYICDKFEELQFYCERFSNNNKPEFTDQEIMTIYLYTMQHEGHTKVKHIYRFASEWLGSWFPKLGSYQAFNANPKDSLQRTPLEGILWIGIGLHADHHLFCPKDSFGGKRSGKVAREVTDKGYCSTKGPKDSLGECIIMGLNCTCAKGIPSDWVFGVLENCLTRNRYYLLSNPKDSFGKESLGPASVNDLTVFKQAWSGLDNRTFWGDKIYFVKELNEYMLKQQNSEILTPVKGVKGMPDVTKQRIKAANDLFSTAVSKVRQPVEAIFNWLIEKTDIQRASKVRSTKGLMVHVFGRLNAAFINLAF